MILVQTLTLEENWPEPCSEYFCQTQSQTLTLRCRCEGSKVQKLIMQSQDQIWDPEHDWILHFERILKPGGALASSALAKNDTAKFRHHHEGTVSCIRPSIN